MLLLAPISKNKILFDNFGGRGYGDNPKFIADEILRQGLGYDLVWMVNSHEEVRSLPPGIRAVKRGSLRLLRELATAKVWVDNIKNGIVSHKRKGQYYIQTWHGGGIPLKLVEQQVEGLLDRHYVVTNKRMSRQIDLILSENDIISRRYREAFWLPESCEIFEHGLPRNDIFFTSQATIAAKRKNYADERTCLLLYAPTFRDDGSTEGYRLNIRDLRETLEKKTRRPWKVIVRLHPNAMKDGALFTYDDYIIDGSQEADAQTLTLISDMLITDYSGLMYNFLLMQRPIFLFATDLEHFQQHCRPLTPIYQQLPFALCRSNHELLNAIMTFDEESYYQRVQHFMQSRLLPFDDGHASEHVVGRIKAVVEGTFRKE